MRKNLLALSIAAMIGGVSGMANAAVFPNTANAGTLVAPAAAARATVLNPTVTGVGHILTVPYFTTQGTNTTLLNIVNTDTVNGKAVKLRFRGAANSDDIFDITIYLSPGDMWSANVSANGDLSALTTSDTSCTLPSIADIKATNGLFKTGRVNPTNSNAETREGYIEILNTADIPENTATNSLYTAIKHVAGKAPCTASVMDQQANELVAGHAKHDPATRGYSWPTGGLTANWVIVNTADMASFSGEAVAVRAEVVTAPATTGVSGAGNLVWFPQTTDAPTYQAGQDVTTFTADPVLQHTSFSGQVANYDFPDLSTPYTGAVTSAVQAGNLANALATKSVVNEYMVGGPANFSTDWVFSSPTRRYAAGVDYAAKTLRFNANVAAHYDASNTSLNTSTLQACVVPGGSLKGFSREEDTQSTFVISPDTALKLCGETSVLTFGSTKVLNAAIASRSVPVNYAEGWMTIGTNGKGAGLPVIGFAAVKTKGSNLGGTWTHRTSK